MVRLDLTRLSFSSVSVSATAIMADDGYLQGFGLEAVAALIMFQMWIVCTQITINLGGSLQLPAEAALLCKDWLAIRAPGCGLRRTESANPAGVILIKCCLCRRMTRTLLPPCASLSCQADHRPPFNCLTIQRTNWNASRFPVALTVVNIFIRSSLNHRHQYFVQKLTTLRGAGVPPLGPECQFAKGN